MPNTSDDDGSELSRCWIAWILQRDFGGTDAGKLGALYELHIAVKREMQDRGHEDKQQSLGPIL